MRIYLVILTLCSWFFGFSQTTFGPPNLLTEGQNSVYDIQKVIHADFDNDGDEDILTLANGNRIALFENLNGQGLFSSAKFLNNYGQDIQSFEVLDLNQDGFIDLIYVNTPREIYWQANLSGSGAFGDRIMISRTISDVVDVEVLDMNQDNILDLVVMGFSNIIWYQNKDSLGYFEEIPIAITDGGRRGFSSMEIIDFDGDGDLDLAAIASFDSILLKYENQDTIFTVDTLLENAHSINQLDVGDIDGDGDLDIITEGGIDFKLIWFENIDASGVFGSPIILPSSDDFNQIKLFDADGDGDLDVFASKYRSFQYFENSGQGIFDDVVFISDEEFSGWNPQFVDLNSDGFIDILSYREEELICFKALNNDGDFSLKDNLNNYHFRLKDILADDIDNDGDVDIIGGDFIQGKLFWLENENALFSNHQVAADLNGIAGFHSGDIDGNGTKDLVAADGEKITWYSNVDGKGSFSKAKLVTDLNSNYTNVHLVDLDQDLDLDIAFAADDGTAGWYQNLNGQGDFGNYYQFGFPFFGSDAIEPCDIDQDGDIDFIGVFGIDPVWYENEDGFGKFNQKVALSFQNVNKEAGVFPADIDGDGDLDILHADPLGWIENVNDFTIFLNSNIIDDGTRFTYDLRAADLDNDGDLDVIRAVYGDGVYWYENLNGLGVFGDRKLIYRINEPLDDAIFTADLDNDGDLDILSSSLGVIWAQNLKYKTSIEGFCFFDKNENKIKDNGEVGLLNHAMFLSPEAVNAFTNNQGEYNFAVGKGNYILSGIVDDLWQLTTDSSSYNVTLINMPVEDLNFGLKPTRILSEVVSTQHYPPTRCGFPVSFWINTENRGTTFESGQIEFELDTLIQFISAEPAPENIQGNKYYWNLDTLAPTYNNQIQIELRMPGVDKIGERVGFNTTTFLRDNAGSLISHHIRNDSSIINCAYDPNDKLVVPKGIKEEKYTQFGEEFEFTIRFQNTGTDTAFNVSIHDHLDIDLDWSTFKPIGASHNYTAKLFDYGRVVFDFDNIMLPDSNVNYIGSQGYVSFRIKHKEGLDEKTKINNLANIYFDFNPAIVTNNTMNTLVTDFPVSIHIFQERMSLHVFPNPAEEYINFEIPHLEMEEVQLRIFNLNGILIENQSFRKKTKVNSSHYVNGVYYFILISKQRGIIANGTIIKQ